MLLIAAAGARAAADGHGHGRRAAAHRERGGRDPDRPPARAAAVVSRRMSHELLADVAAGAGVVILMVHDT